MDGQDYPPSRALKDIYLPVNIRTSNPSEISVAQDLEAEGWTLYKRGWPDFVAVRGDEVRLIEVKPQRTTPMAPAQGAIARLLERKLGIRIEKISPSHPPILRSEAKEFFAKLRDNQQSGSSDSVM